MSAMTPETPARIEDNLVRIPDGQDVPQEPAPAPRPWYRRRRPVLITLAAIAVLLGGLAAGLLTTVFASRGPADPAAVLKADGYSLMMSFTPAQMSNLGALNGSGALAKPYVASMVIGGEGPGRRDRGRPHRRGRGQGQGQPRRLRQQHHGHRRLRVTWHMTSGDLVVDAPASMLNGTSPQGT